MRRIRLARNPVQRTGGRRYGIVKINTGDKLDRGFGLPVDFTDQDWRAALDYWNHRCAVCGRAADEDVIIARDHWYPLSRIGCPGTIPSNVVPLCHGLDGCNNLKGNREPLGWLVQTLGREAGMEKWNEIQAFFEWVRQTEHDE